MGTPSACQVAHLMTLSSPCPALVAALLLASAPALAKGQPRYPAAPAQAARRRPPRSPVRAWRASPSTASPMGLRVPLPGPDPVHRHRQRHLLRRLAPRRLWRDGMATSSRHLLFKGTPPPPTSPRPSPSAAPAPMAPLLDAPTTTRRSRLRRHLPGARLRGGRMVNDFIDPKDWTVR
jgi:hypothetical protein